MTTPAHNEKDKSLFSFDTLCYPTLQLQPESPKYLAAVKEDHQSGIQYQCATFLQRLKTDPLLEEMAPVDNDARYHLLPEQESQTVDGSTTDEGSLVELEGKTPTHSLPIKVAFSFSFHTTVITRLLAIVFGIASIALFFECWKFAPAVLGIFCVLRNTQVVCSWMFTVSITFGKNKTIQPSKSSILTWISVLLEVSLCIAQFVALTVTGAQPWTWRDTSDNRRPWSKKPGCITGYIAIACHLLSILDVGHFMVYKCVSRFRDNGSRG